MQDGREDLASLVRPPRRARRRLPSSASAPPPRRDRSGADRGQAPPGCERRRLAGHGSRGRRPRTRHVALARERVPEGGLRARAAPGGHGLLREGHGLVRLALVRASGEGTACRGNARPAATRASMHLTIPARSPCLPLLQAPRAQQLAPRRAASFTLPFRLCYVRTVAQHLVPAVPVVAASSQ